LKEKEKEYNNICTEIDNKNKEYKILNNNYEKLVDQLHTVKKENTDIILELNIFKMNSEK
jgi:septation ring formation regulator EzrA